MTLQLFLAVTVLIAFTVSETIKNGQQDISSVKLFNQRSIPTEYAIVFC